jgi:spoIIIJ-associated protein
MQEVERSAASVDAAVEAALAELGADRADVDVEVLDEGRSGFLGVGSAEARVRVTVREATDGPRSLPAEPSTDGADSGMSAREGSVEQIVGEATEAADAGTSGEEGTGGAGAKGDEWLDDQADLVADFLEDLFDAMDLRAEVEPVYEDGTMYVDVWTEDEDESLALLIGRHGAALDALQEIVRGVVHHRTGERCQVVVDVEDYRKRRRAQLVSRARQAAERVEKSGQPERLDPMNAFERKIVHDAVSNISGVTTGSEGEEPDRRVVISPS